MEVVSFECANAVFMAETLNETNIICHVIATVEQLHDDWPELVHLGWLYATSLPVLAFAMPCRVRMVFESERTVESSVIYSITPDPQQSL